jgi:hypothetical protein
MVSPDLKSAPTRRGTNYATSACDFRSIRSGVMMAPDPKSALPMHRDRATNYTTSAINFYDAIYIPGACSPSRSACATHKALSDTRLVEQCRRPSNYAHLVKGGANLWNIRK